MLTILSIITLFNLLFSETKCKIVVVNIFDISIILIQDFSKFLVNYIWMTPIVPKKGTFLLLPHH